MLTLKKLVEEQKWNGMTDIQIIMTFLDLNNMEEEAMELINDLVKTKISKLKHNERIVREWTSYLPSKYLYENYDLDTADMLHTIELDYLSNGCKLSNGRLEWAKENIPNIKMPRIYFRPLIEWLDDKDIRFKDEKPIGNKTFMDYC